MTMEDPLFENVSPTRDGDFLIVMLVNSGVYVQSHPLLPLIPSLNCSAKIMADLVKLKRSGWMGKGFQVPICRPKKGAPCNGCLGDLLGMKSYQKGASC